MILCCSTLVFNTWQTIIKCHLGAKKMFFDFLTMWLLNPRNDIKSGQKASFPLQLILGHFHQQNSWGDTGIQITYDCTKTHYRAHFWSYLVLVYPLFTYKKLKIVWWHKKWRSSRFLGAIVGSHTFHVLHCHNHALIIQATQVLFGNFRYLIIYDTVTQTPRSQMLS